MEYCWPPHLSPFLVLPAVSQAGIVVRDLAQTLEFYTKIFQVGPFRIFEPEYTDRMYRGKPENFKMRLALASWGPIELELIQTLEGKTIYDEFLRAHGEGLHHLGFVVRNLGESIQSFQKIGAEVLQSGKRPGVSWAYLDTQPLAGLIVELIERQES